MSLVNSYQYFPFYSFYLDLFIFPWSIFAHFTSNLITELLTFISGRGVKIWPLLGGHYWFYGHWFTSSTKSTNSLVMKYRTNSKNWVLHFFSSVVSYNKIVTVNFMCQIIWVMVFRCAIKCYSEYFCDDVLNEINI